MGGPTEYSTKWSKSERQVQMLYDVTYMQDLTKIIQILYTKQTHRHRTQTYRYQRGKGEGNGRLGL